MKKEQDLKTFMPNGTQTPFHYQVHVS